MPRAPLVCSQPGCPEPATGYGRCKAHRPKYKNPEPWARRVPVPRGHARWRREVMQRDEYRCRKCGEQATEADHIISRAVAPHLALDIDNGQALCSRCHRAKTQAESRAASERRRR